MKVEFRKHSCLRRCTHPSTLLGSNSTIYNLSTNPSCSCKAQGLLSGRTRWWKRNIKHSRRMLHSPLPPSLPFFSPKTALFETHQILTGELLSEPLETYIVTQHHGSLRSSVTGLGQLWIPEAGSIVFAVCSASFHAPKRHVAAVERHSDCHHDSQRAFIINHSRIYLASILPRRPSRTQLAFITDSHFVAATRTR